MHVNTTDTECKLKLWTSFVVGIILYISSNYRRYTKCKYLRTKQYLQEEVKCERTPREDENARMREDDGAREHCENARMLASRSVGRSTANSD
jgi:cell shape-determining protein MreC